MASVPSSNRSQVQALELEAQAQAEAGDPARGGRRGGTARQARAVQGAGAPAADPVARRGGRPGGRGTRLRALQGDPLVGARRRAVGRDGGGVPRRDGAGAGRRYRSEAAAVPRADGLRCAPCSSWRITTSSAAPRFSCSAGSGSPSSPRPRTARPPWSCSAVPATPDVDRVRPRHARDGRRGVHPTGRRARARERRDHRQRARCQRSFMPSRPSARRPGCELLGAIEKPLTSRRLGRAARVLPPRSGGAAGTRARPWRRRRTSRRALDDGRIIVRFRPTVDLSSGRVSGAEALAGWHEPRTGGSPVRPCWRRSMPTRSSAASRDHALELAVHAPAGVRACRTRHRCLGEGAAGATWATSGWRTGSPRSCASAARTRVSSSA